MNKVPINIGDKIMSKAEVVRKAIRKKFPDIKSFDHDGDGYISLHDLGKSLAKLDIVHTAEERRGLMNFLDSNANGYVDFKEFSKRI